MANELKNLAKGIKLETIKPSDFTTFYKTLCNCILAKVALLIEGVCLIRCDQTPHRNKSGSKVYPVVLLGVGEKTYTVRSIFGEIWHYVLEKAFDSVIISDLENWLLNLPTKEKLEFGKDYTFSVALNAFKHLSTLQLETTLDAIRKTVTDNNFISRNGTFTIEGEKVKIPSGLRMDIDTVKKLVNFAISMPKAKNSEGAKAGADLITENSGNKSGKKSGNKSGKKSVNLPAVHKTDKKEGKTETETSKQENK